MFQGRLTRAVLAATCLTLAGMLAYPPWSVSISDGTDVYHIGYGWIYKPPSSPGRPQSASHRGARVNWNRLSAQMLSVIFTAGAVIVILERRGRTE
jgi:hypothetical protein